MMKQINNWTEEQVGILVKKYPDKNINIKEISSEIGKSISAIKTIAQKLEVYRGNQKRTNWTDDELRAVKDLYAKMC